MCRPIDVHVLGVHDVRRVDLDVQGGDVCCQGMRRVRVKKLVHFVKNLRRGATTKALDEKPWWKMLALHSGMERMRLEAGVGPGSGAGRQERQSSHATHARRAVECAVDRAVRLAAVSTDLQLDLPPSIPLPDGEELPHGASTRLHIRDPEQESEIYQKCVRPPPNRTVFDGESPPPYRSSSASAGSGGGAAVLRYPQPQPHPVSAPAPVSMPAGFPAVIVPSPPRKQDPTSPALFLAGPGTTGKHSTGPAPAALNPAPPPGSTAAGLVRLLSPCPTVERPVTVKPKACRTAQSASAASARGGSGQGSVEIVNVASTACSPAARDIPRAARSGGGGGSHLAALTMVPCLNESRTEMTPVTTTTSTTTTTRTEPSPSSSPNGSCREGQGQGQGADPSPSSSPSTSPSTSPSPSPSPSRTRSGAAAEPLARPLPRPPV